MKNNKRLILLLFFIVINTSVKSQITGEETFPFQLPNSPYIIARENVDVSPNPMSEKAVIQIPGIVLDDRYEVYISNIYRTFKRKIIIFDPKQIVISREDLPDGVYFCWIISPDMKVYSTKFIVQ